MLWRDRDARGKPRSIARALTAGERSAVERRHHDLKEVCAAFTPAEQDLVVAALSRMLGGFRSLRHDDEEAAIAGLDGLRHVLAPFPLWAIKAGCLAISRNEAVIEGKKVDHRFPPNDGEIFAVVRDLLKPYQDAWRNAAALLAAPVQCASGPACEANGARSSSDLSASQAEVRAVDHTSDGNHGTRVMADLAARKAGGGRRDAQYDSEGIGEERIS